MYYFLIHAGPDPTHDRDPEAGAAAGVFVSYSIDFKDIDGAALLAKAGFQQTGCVTSG